MSHIPYYNETQSRSGYELRTELVDIISNYIIKQQELYIESMTAAFKEGQITVNELREAIKPITVEHMLQTVESVYGFVNRK